MAALPGCVLLDNDNRSDAPAANVNRPVPRHGNETRAEENASEINATTSKLNSGSTCVLQQSKNEARAEQTQSKRKSRQSLANVGVSFGVCSGSKEAPIIETYLGAFSGVFSGLENKRFALSILVLRSFLLQCSELQA